MKQRTAFTVVYIIIVTALCLMRSPADANASHLSGTWRSRGYGYILKIDALQTDHSGNPFYPAMIFDETVVSLLPSDSIRISAKDHFLLSEKKDLSGTVWRRGNRLKYRSFSDGTVIIFDRLCTKKKPAGYDIAKETDNPIVNFNVLWWTFEENCSIFSLTDVDWQMMYDYYRPLITEHTMPQELFDIFTQMLTPLNDGHTNLAARIDGEIFYFNAGPAPRSIWMMERIDEMFAVISSYLDGNSLHEAVEDRIYYGTIDQSIGYLNILGYVGYSESDIDAVFSKLQKTEALIIDIRMNMGGSAGLACALASRLASHKFRGYSKQARVGDYEEFSRPVPIYIAPAGAQFLDRPVVILTSGNTISAADVQAMILKNPALPNVTLIGESTSGNFSNGLPKSLPNGWEFTLSNERCLADNMNYEQIGITPDIEVIGSEAALDKGDDNILERALKMLRRYLK